MTFGGFGLRRGVVVGACLGLSLVLAPLRGVNAGQLATARRMRHKAPRRGAEGIWTASPEFVDVAGRQIGPLWHAALQRLGGREHMHVEAQTSQLDEELGSLTLGRPLAVAGGGTHQNELFAAHVLRNHSGDGYGTRLHVPPPRVVTRELRIRWGTPDAIGRSGGQDSRRGPDLRVQVMAARSNPLTGVTTHLTPEELRDVPATALGVLRDVLSVMAGPVHHTR